MRIGTDLSNASPMLREILEPALRDIRGATVERLPASGSFDAVLFCNDGPENAALPDAVATRFVAVSRRGDALWLLQGGTVVKIPGAVSVAQLHACLAGEVPAGAARAPLLKRWFGGTRPLPQPARAAPTPRLAALDRWLAARILAVGRTGVSAEGSAALERIAGNAGAAPVEPELPGLDRVAALYGLEPAERELLLVATLVETSADAARLMALLGGQTVPRRMTIGQVAALGRVPADYLVRLRDGAPLIADGLLTLQGDGPFVTREIAVPTDVAAFVLGKPSLPAFALVPLGEDARGRRFSDEFGARLEALARALSERVALGAPMVIVTGQVDSGRRDVARALAAAVRHVTVEVRFADLATEERQAALRRTARLHEAAVILSDPPQADAGFRWDDLLRGIDCPVFVMAPAGSFAVLAARIDRPAIPLELPRRDIAERCDLWRQAVPSMPAEEHRCIAERFDFGAAGVGRAVRLATSVARIAGRPAPARDDLLSACDDLRTAEFKGAAQRLHGVFQRSDIVLRPETEAELDLAIAWARHGAQVFGAGGAGEALNAGQGLACLFSGPPGTGKTMAAQIIAREVDYALYRIDISQVIDKFIGESEKRLAALFDEAERSRVGLFFDEADACFGKRTELRDSHDRYANVTIDFLLQRLESFDGLAILATNLVGNMDDAFLRRIRVRADFLPPGPEERRLIWARLLPPEGARAEDIDIPILADAFDLVGGEIRNAIYTAHLLAAGEAAPLAMRHCVRGLWRELAKVGRLSDRTRLGPWQHLVPKESPRHLRAAR